MLLSLLSGQRGQTILSFNIDHMIINKTEISFQINSLLKCSKPGRHSEPVIFRAYQEDPSLCVRVYVQAYLLRTKELRKDETQLFISYQKPYKAISRDTLARWIRTTMQLAGIDTAIFKPHSTRAASVSTAAKFLPTKSILKAVGWSQESTFYKYYKSQSSYRIRSRFSQEC